MNTRIFPFKRFNLRFVIYKKDNTVNWNESSCHQINQNSISILKVHFCVEWIARPDEALDSQDHNADSSRKLI